MKFIRILTNIRAPRQREKRARLSDFLETIWQVWGFSRPQFVTVTTGYGPAVKVDLHWN